VSARASNFFLRAAVALVMALMIGAPTPGYVQGCSGAGGGGAVDPVEFCIGKSSRVCARDEVAGRISRAEYQACIDRIPSNCEGNTFMEDCNPTFVTVQACYDALVDPLRVGTPDSGLAECMSICTGSGGGFEPEGI
jgi:hypothetical protein